MCKLLVPFVGSSVKIAFTVGVNNLHRELSYRAALCKEFVPCPRYGVNAAKKRPLTPAAQFSWVNLSLSDGI